MDIIRQQRDDDNLDLWHFKIGGVANDGLYRLADLSRETTTPADWLAANQAEAQAAIDAGEYNAEYDTEVRKPAEGAANFRNLPNWATWTGHEAAEALRTGILNGMTKTEARAAIDAQFNGATTAAAIKAAAIAVLKTLSDAIIDGRDLGHQKEAKAIMYLRDINRV